MSASSELTRIKRALDRVRANAIDTASLVDTALSHAHAGNTERANATNLMALDKLDGIIEALTKIREEI